MQKNLQEKLGASALLTPLTNSVIPPSNNPYPGSRVEKPLRRQPISSRWTVSGLTGAAAFILFATAIFQISCLFALASSPLPHVSPQMEKPEFWIKKISNPDRPLLAPEGIRKINEENLKRQDLYLCDVKSLREEWARDELLALIEEDWQGFGDHTGPRYGKDGRLLDSAFWNGLRSAIPTESLQNGAKVRFGLIVKRTDIRVFPTGEASLNGPNGGEFDRFQHSMVSPGSLVAVYFFSRDQRWAYSQVQFIRGWIRGEDIALGKERDEAIAYHEREDRLVVTGSFIKVYGDASQQQVAFSTQMGSAYPILDRSQRNASGRPIYVISIPSRERDGQLSFRNGFVSQREDVHPGFLPYTQANVARQAFKMLHEPYGWGELGGGRDCSRLIMDVFDSFGIVMPRNSKFQAMLGKSLGEVEGKTIDEKRKILDRAPPFATVLRLPGHIMLYLGKHKGRHYVIHSLWATTRKGTSGATPARVSRVVVSDLSQGGSNPHESLLRRVTDIRYFGSDSTISDVITGSRR